MASGVRNLLVIDGKGEKMLVLTGVQGIAEIRVHNEMYHVLDKGDNVRGIYPPEKVLRVNMSDHEIGLLLRT